MGIPKESGRQYAMGINISIVLLLLDHRIHTKVQSRNTAGSAITHTHC